MAKDKGYMEIEFIKVSDRQRKTFDEEALKKLAESIAQHGLFHAPVIRDGRVLVAGERRLRAMTKLHADKIPFEYNKMSVPWNQTPVVDIDSKDELHALEMELDENIIREDITWQDRVRALNDIQKLRAARNPKQTYKATAQEVQAKTNSTKSVQVIQEEISRAMVTSEFLDIPEVRNAKNERWAFNAAARILRDEFASKLGSKVVSRHEVYQGRAEERLAEFILEGRKFNTFIIDPPYGINADTFHPGNSPAEQLHTYMDDVKSAFKFGTKLFDLCGKLATPDAHLWMFCDVELFKQLRAKAQELGWIVFRTPIIWNKGSVGYILRKANIRRGYEMLLFAQRSDARGLSQVMQDVITVSSQDGEKEHAAQKPMALYELLIRMSCLPDDKVLDPCCGSGTVFHAAQKQKVSAVGVELDEKYYEACKKLLVELEVGSDKAGALGGAFG